MGYFRHKTIVVKGYREEIERLHRDIDLILRKNYPELLFLPQNGPAQTLLSSIVVARSNGFASFFIGPDGSKEGWGTSNEGDRAFEQIKALLNSDFGQWVDYVEVEIGGDDGCASIMDTNLRLRRPVHEE